MAGSGRAQVEDPPAEGALLERVLSLEALRWAWHRVESNRGSAGGDGVSLSRFERRLDANLLALADDVRDGRYRPGRVRHVRITTGEGPARKMRTIAIGPVRDRVLQRAVLEVLTPLGERRFLPRSHGYRPGRSVQGAVEHIVRLREAGHWWVIDADIRDCFGSLDRVLIGALLRGLTPDAALCRLVEAWVGPARDAHGRPRRGIDLGMVVAPFLCNLVLHQLDEGLRRRRILSVRYADDFVVLCRSPEHAERALRTTEKLLRGLRLELNLAKTRVVDFDTGFDFLGVRFDGIDYRYDLDGMHVTVRGLPPDEWDYHASGYC